MSLSRGQQGQALRASVRLTSRAMPAVVRERGREAEEAGAINLKLLRNKSVF